MKREDLPLSTSSPSSSSSSTTSSPSRSSSSTLTMLARSLGPRRHPLPPGDSQDLEDEAEGGSGFPEEGESKPRSPGERRIVRAAACDLESLDDLQPLLPHVPCGNGCGSKKSRRGHLSLQVEPVHRLGQQAEPPRHKPQAVQARRKAETPTFKFTAPSGEPEGGKGSPVCQRGSQGLHQEFLCPRLFRDESLALRKDCLAASESYRARRSSFGCEFAKETQGSWQEQYVLGAESPMDVSSSAPLSGSLGDLLALVERHLAAQNMANNNNHNHNNRGNGRNNNNNNNTSPSPPWESGSPQQQGRASPLGQGPWGHGTKSLPSSTRLARSQTSLLRPDHFSMARSQSSLLRPEDDRLLSLGRSQSSLLRPEEEHLLSLGRSSRSQGDLLSVGRPSHQPRRRWTTLRGLAAIGRALSASSLSLRPKRRAAPLSSVTLDLGQLEVAGGRPRHQSPPQRGAWARKLRLPEVRLGQVYATLRGRRHRAVSCDSSLVAGAKLPSFVGSPQRLSCARCDAVRYELRSKGVDGGLYLTRGAPGEERMRGEATGDYMLDLLERMSNYRIDDQRCSLPHNIHPPQQGMREGPGKPPPDKDEPISKTTSRHRLEEILDQPGPYPQVVLPVTGGYWDEHTADGDHQYVTNNSNNKFETDETALYYRRYFLGHEHWTFFGEDELHGPVVLSHKREVISSQENLRVLLRLKTGTHHATIINLGDNPTPAKMAKRLKEELTVERFHPVVTPEGPELILAYDEHVLKNHFKFGLIYQRFGQTMEEQLFSNRGHLSAFEEFLSLMGQRVKLKDHEGFKGGLDTQFGQTGEESIYEVFREKEIMFHVSTLLPYKENDSQQLERKRHIGNDMVAVVFQEANTPFAPDMIASHFLHAYIVIQPIDPCTQNTRYRVSVTARSDVPFFGPTLPPTSIFDKGPHFKEFLLTKLINAEIACYKAERFAKLEMRTRSSLLSALVDDLRMKTNEYLGVTEIPETPKVETAGNKFREIVRSVLIGRKNPDPSGVLKKPIPNNTNTLVTGTPVSARSKGSGGSSGARTPTSSPDTTPNTHMALSESDDSSLNSMDIDGHPHPLNEDSDTGLESMSSAETPHKLSLQCPLCGGSEDGVCALHADPETIMRQVDTLKHEINKLKCDKLDLLRQNVTCQREIKKLKEKELKLGGELNTASKEILRLQNLLKDLGTGQVSAV